MKDGGSADGVVIPGVVKESGSGDFTEEQRDEGQYEGWYQVKYIVDD